MPLTGPDGGARPRRVAVAVGSVAVLAIAAVLVWLAAGSGTVAKIHAAHTVAPAPLPSFPPTDPRRLAADLNWAQATIDSRASASGQLATAGLFEELATGTLAAKPAGARKLALAMLSNRAAASMRTDLAASASLSSLTFRHRRLPPWKIVSPPPPTTLLRYYRIAQARSQIPWQYLAAIELIETRFGRVRGPSSAGAQGPMQFLPSTWARYGRGSINNQRGAILAAARFLHANGGPADMGDALYHYNNSSAYVAAVREYASRIRSDPRAYDGYYYWQVVYPLNGRAVILPAGFPRTRPVLVP